MPAASLDTVTQNVYEEMASITLLSIPLFILKGAAIGRSDAGRDLYLAMHAWMQRVPGRPRHRQRVHLRAVRRDGGSSPATCSAIGSAGIPEMRRRGYSPGFAAGIIAAGGTLGILLPPSITMILYAVAAEVSLGRLFLAGIGPGLLLVGAVRAVRDVPLPQGVRRGAGRVRQERPARTRSSTSRSTRCTRRWRCCRACCRSSILLIGVMVALYGGYATPSETAGLGAVLALALIAVMYGVRRPGRIAPILGATLKESTMLMFIVGMSLLFSYVMSYLHISQSAASGDRRAAPVEVVPARGGPADGRGPRLLPAAGQHHPDDGADHPAAAAGAAGFDLIWFGVLMTIVMEMGLIHPPVGLNLFVIKNVAPDIPIADVIWGVLPFVRDVVAIVVICLVPGIATWFPNAVMGPPGR